MHSITVCKIFVSKKIRLTYLVKTLFSLLWIMASPYQTKSQSLSNVSGQIQGINKPKAPGGITSSGSYLKTTSGQTCPSGGSVGLNGMDTEGDMIMSGQTIPCGSPSFTIAASMASPAVSPCVRTQYTSIDALLPGAGTETFYEGTTDELCVGPSSSCIYAIGNGMLFSALSSQWQIEKIYLDPSKQHDFSFCYTGLTPALTSVQLQDCWTGDTLTASHTLTASCFSLTLPANTDIGTAVYSISPASATSSLTDHHNGKAYINTATLPNGVYTVTYTFTPPAADNCSPVNGTFKFTIAPIALTASSATVCAGSTATLTVNGATTYSWSPAGGLSNPIDSVVTATPGSTAFYTVTGTSGVCSATATSTITVNPIPTVTVNSAFICSSGTVTLMAGGATNYIWSPATGLSATTGSIVTADPSATTTYTVKGASKGCKSFTTSLVTVSSTLNISVNSATVCAGSTVTLTAGGATNYTWSPSGGLSVTSGSVVTVNTSSTTVYTIHGSNGTCYATQTATVTIIPTTTIQVTANINPICAGTSSTLTATGASSYSWAPAGTLNSIIGGMVIATPSVNVTYTVSGSIGNCSATPGIITLTVNPIPVINIIAFPASICSGSSSTLTASGATTYSWAPSTSLTVSSNGNAIVNPTGTETYNVTGTQNGCSATAIATVTVNPTPTITVNSSTLCATGAATLTANGATNYTWSPSGGLSVTSGSVVTVNTSSTTIYTIHGSNGTCYATQTATVTIIPTTTIQVTANINPICAGTSSTLTATGASSYSWAPAGTLNSIIGGMVIATPSVNVTYTVSGSIGNCSATPGIITLTVNPIPVINIIAFPASICSGSSSTLTASGATTYSWAPSTSLTVSSNGNAIVNPTGTETYNVTGTQNGCSATAIATVTVNPTPTITVNSLTLCATATATLTANGATNYTWSPSGGLSVTSGSVVTVNTSSTTVYTIHGSTGTCYATQTATVTITPTTTIQVTANINPICAGSTSTLTATGASSYNWAPAGTLNSTTGGTVTANPSGSITYTVSGNTGSCPAVSAILTLTVLSTPIINITPAPAAICSGNSSTLTAIGATSYSWAPAAGLSITSGTTVIVNPVNTETYTVTGITNGCHSFKSIVIQVNQAPNITITTSSASICSGGQTTLTAANGISYTWAPAGSLNNIHTASVVASPSLATIYTVSGSDSLGCSNSFTTAINVSPIPLVTPTVSSTNCVGQSISLAGNSISGSVTYLWSGPNSYTSSLQNPVISNITLGAAGIYTLSITSGNCNATDTIRVAIYNSPTLAYAGRDTVIYTSTLFLNGNIALVGMGTWSVISGSGNFSNNNTASVVVSNLQVGQNVLQWAISNGTCPVSSDDIIVTVKDLMVPNGFSPNGDRVNDNFEINGLDEYNQVTLHVLNRWGNMVYESSDYKNNWNGKNMSGEDLSDDTYYFTLKIDSKNTVKGYVVLKRK